MDEVLRLVEKYPEFTDMLKGGVIPEDVIDAEIKEKENDDGNTFNRNF